MKIGDKVKVLDVNGRRRGQPDGGWDGVVTYVGRKLVTIQYGHIEEKFRLDTRRTNDGYAHRQFTTPQEADDRMRSGLYTLELRQAGVTIDWSRKTSYTADQLEQLAALVTSFRTESPG